TGLRQLSLANTAVTDLAPLAALDKLEFLDASGVVGGPALGHVGELRSLKVLTLGGQRGLTEANAASLRSLAGLTALDLSNQTVGPEAAAAIGSLKQLRILML